jgi:uncharacterized membrane protein YfhO
MGKIGNRKIIIAQLCFWIPALIMLVAFASMGMAPFGKSSTMIMDMSDQYVEFLCGLKYGDVYYSWSKTLGGNYIGIFAYYVSSPLSVFTLFWPNSQMPVAVLFLTMIKIGLAGFTFSLFLKYRFRRYDLPTVLFSIMYALMAYNVVYSMCIMWLDGVIWLPVILIGVEKVLKGKSRKLLIFALFMSFISTYYISYMTGLFTALYFLYRCIEKKLWSKKLLTRAWLFASSVILAASLGAFFLLPTLASLISGELGASGMKYGSTFNFKFGSFIEKFVTGAYDSITNNAAPFVYCGIASVTLLVIFFFVKKVSLRSKILTGIFTVLMIASMWLSPLDKVWHVFKYPNWFPYRYSFLFSFLVIFTAYKAFIALKLNRRVICIVLILLCSFEMYINSVGILRGLDKEFRYESYDSYYEYKERLTPLIEQTAEDDEGFFRVGVTFERSKNEAIGFGYNGLTHYSSSYDKQVNNLVKKMGMAQAWYFSAYFGSTMVTDSVFSVRYVISDLPVSPYYVFIGHNESALLYYNPNALSIGAAVNEDSLFGFDYDNDPFYTQNRLIMALTGTNEKCFIPLDVSKTDTGGTSEYNFISNGMPVYAFFSCNDSYGSLEVNGRGLGQLFTNESDCIHYIGSVEEGKNVNVVVNRSNVFESFYYLDMGVFERAVKTLKAMELEVEHYDNRSVSGSVTAREGDVLFTSIPYDEGWSVRVNGKKVELKKFADSLIAVPLNAGENKVQMTYTAKGFTAGVWISLAALIVLLIPLAIKIYSNDKEKSSVKKSVDNIEKV